MALPLVLSSGNSGPIFRADATGHVLTYDSATGKWAGAPIPPPPPAPSSIARLDFGAEQVGSTLSFAIPFGVGFSSINENLTTQLPAQRNIVVTRLYAQFDTPLDPSEQATLTLRVNESNTLAVVVITGPNQSGFSDELIAVPQNARVSVGIISNVPVIDRLVRIAAEYRAAA